MKTFYKILCACLACLCVVIYAGQTDRVTELETERDIYQSRANAAETALSKKREITLPSTETCEINGNAPAWEYAGEFDVTANCCESGCSTVTARDNSTVKELHDQAVAIKRESYFSKPVVEIAGEDTLRGPQKGKE